jgi:hypothetical protein
MRQQSNGGGFPELGALLAAWLVFYVVILVHGSITPYADRLAKAWTVQDNAEGAPGGALAVRESLALSANRISH